ncbi:hypothetical protein AB0M48_05490 [Lentzea sp. NPDC051208]|uniref:hypothetical protein n=1 Tax=Lentzea sp. NPDC051208 TaxID=3154642 RepID=UPI003448F4AF
MNSIMERWVKALRVELLDRTLESGPLTHALPLEPGRIERLTIDRQDRLGGVIHEYRHPA